MTDEEFTRLVDRAKASSDELTKARLDNWPDDAIRPLEVRHDLLWREVNDSDQGKGN